MKKPFVVLCGFAAITLIAGTAVLVKRLNEAPAVEEIDGHVEAAVDVNSSAAEAAASSQAGQEEVQIHKTAIIPVEGMVCHACTASLTRRLRALDGVRAVQVSLADRSARVEYVEGEVDPATLAEAVRQAGFRPGQVSETP